MLLVIALPFHSDGQCCLLLLTISFCRLVSLTFAYNFFAQCCLLLLTNSFFLTVSFFSQVLLAYYIPFLFDARCRLLLLTIISVAWYCLLLLAVSFWCCFLLLTVWPGSLAIAYRLFLSEVFLAIAYCFFLSTGVACYCLLFLSVEWLFSFWHPVSLAIAYCFFQSPGVACYRLPFLSVD